jgi:hypothetical protein
MNYLTRKDVDDFGPELLDVAQRAAQHAVGPELAQLREENQQLHDEVSRAAKLAIDQVLDREVPSWREINASEQFHSWLLLPEPYSGIIRDRLLKDAVAAANAQRGRLLQGFPCSRRASSCGLGVTASRPRAVRSTHLQS